MPNLKALRNKIKNITDYSPELQGYNDQLDDLINEAYLDIWTEKRWNFATKEFEFHFHPDMKHDRDVITPGASITATVTKGSRTVTFSAPMDRLRNERVQGQPIEIQNYEYIISKVVSSSEILLEKVFIGVTSALDTSWIIKHRFYDLPQDCLELLTLGHRDTPHASGGTGTLPPYGKLTAIPARRAEQLNLRRDYAANYAEAFVWSPSAYVEEAHQTTVSITAQEQGPLSTGFPTNTYLEVCWAFVKDGKVGALSEPTTAFFTGDAGPFHLTINFTSWDDQPIVADASQSMDTKPSQWEGLQKVVFWNSNYNRTTGERRGIPVWRFFNNPDGAVQRNSEVFLNAVVAADTADNVDIINFNQLDAGNDIYIEYDGQHQRIQPYPRVDAWDLAVTQQTLDPYSKVNQDFLRVAIGRYYYKPSKLAYSTDSPEMPHEFHHLIVTKVLENVYIKSGSSGNAATYARRYEKEVRRLERRYTDHIDTLMQRGQFSFSAGRNAFYDHTTLKNGG